MPLTKLKIAPGINQEGTNYSNENGWFQGSNVRFRSRLPEKIGGWSKISTSSYLGVARLLDNWVDFSGNNYIGIGTNLKYYLSLGGANYDITPIRITFSHATSPSTDNCFTAGYLSTTVIVTLAGHGGSTGDFVTFSGAVGFAGITSSTLNTEYQIIVLSNNTFSITLPNPATATSTGGGIAITATFQITTGASTYTFGLGWGAGGWGRGGWGSAYSAGIGEQLTLWTSDTYGQDLLLAQRGGAIYYRANTIDNSVRAILLSTSAGIYTPVATNQIISSAVNEFVIALGANSYIFGTPNSTFDPMLVRWSDQANPNQWVPSITNQSGEYRLSRGSYIVMGQVTRQENLIWTDTALYSMQYIGPPYIWSFQLLMDNISIISPNAAVTVNGVTYWMGTDKFYSYSGAVTTLTCTLKQYVFLDISIAN